MGWGLRIKEIAYYGGSLKNLIFIVESRKKKSIGGWLCKNEVLGQFAYLRKRLAKKLSGVFEGCWYQNACYEKLKHRLTGFFYFRSNIVVMICKHFMEGSQEI